jgi:iron complex outermembrane receptor protein
LAVDRTNSALNTGGLQLSLSGRVASVPAGAVIANVKAGFGYQGYLSEDAYPGAQLARSNFVRTDRSTSFNTSLPITSRDSHVGTAAGDLSATVNLSLDDVSSFGTLFSQSYGLDWVPIQKVHFNAIFTDHKMPPTVQQVLAPEAFTPNVEMFDFVKNQTVYVTSIAGGARNLRATDDRVASLGVSLGPFADRTMFSAHYERHRTRDAVGTLPPLTAAVEQSFPERFVRDTNGTLIEVDNRSVNLQRQDMNDLKWGFNAWVPFGNSSKGGTANRLEFSVFDTWVMKDEILIRDGIPILNLLSGAPANGAGGQPRHQIDWKALVYKDGLGAGFNGTWRSATSVGTGDAPSSDILRFSELGTVNLRLFADFDRLPAARNQLWAHGLRIAFQVTNLFDRRQTVLDSAGSTPIAFAPGYLDPVGRTVSLTVRKAF